MIQFEDPDTSVISHCTVEKAGKLRDRWERPSHVNRKVKENYPTKSSRASHYNNILTNMQLREHVMNLCYYIN